MLERGCERLHEAQLPAVAGRTLVNVDAGDASAECGGGFEGGRFGGGGLERRAGTGQSAALEPAREQTDVADAGEAPGQDVA